MFSSGITTVRLTNRLIIFNGKLQLTGQYHTIVLQFYDTYLGVSPFKLSETYF